MRKLFLAVPLIACSVYVLVPVAGAETLPIADAIGGREGTSALYGALAGIWGLFGLSLLKQTK